MKTILLIEDNKTMRENTEEILELSNYKVLAAENGKAGLAFAVTNKPDLIICDIELPDMDESEVLKELNKNTSTKNIPLIFLTARADKSEINNGITCGVETYLIKPFQGNELLNMVAKHLES